MNNTRRPVSYVKLHANVFLRNFADLGSTLPPSNKTLDLKMFYTGDGVELELNGVRGATTAFIPSANIQICEFERESNTGTTSSLRAV